MVQESIDKSNMSQIILDFPKQFREGIKAAENIKIEGRFDAVVVCGMGGSALPGDILNIWLKAYQIGLPLVINRSYKLPIGDEHCLYVCISYSGNTEELLYNYREIIKRGLPVLAITSGGKLAKLAKINKTPAVIVPGNIPPRMALGYQFAALMRALVNAGIIQDELKNILGLEKSLKPKKAEEPGKEVARRLKGKIPIIYTSDLWEPLARIWKTNFCENAKVLAFHNYFPELCHNEVVGFWQINKMQIPNSKLHLLILKDNTVHRRILKQMEIIKNLIKKEGVEVEFIKIKGKDVLEKIFSNVLSSFWASYYLALLYKVDPTPIKITEELKRRLSQAL